MRPALLATVAVLVVLVVLGGLRAAPVTADVAHPVHGDELHLGPATVEIELAGREARYTVRREVRNPGAVADEARLELGLPEGGVVTGLRFQPVRGGPWLRGHLLGVGEARARWDEFADAPFAGARGPALLELVLGVPVLRLLHVPARGRVAFEYTAVAPVCRVGARWFAPAPRFVDEPGAVAALVVRGPRGGGQVVSAAHAETLVGRQVEEACALTAPAAAWGSPHLVTVAAPAVRGAAGALVMLPVGARRLVELTIDTAVELAPAPRDARVVFVVDASRSMGADGVAAQLAMVRAYLARAPGARVELVVYRRHAHRLFGRWVDAADVERALAGVGAGAFAPGNGSNLDAGLAVAAALVAAVPGPRRVVAFTDDRLRADLDEVAASQALAGLPADAVIHAVVTGGGRAAASSLRRDFDHWLASVVAAWGGIAAHGELAALDGGREPAARRAEVFEDLVRPRRLEAVTVASADGRLEELGDVAEGESVRRVALHDDDGITVEGWVWGRRWEPARVTDERVERRLARLAFAEPERVAELSEDVRRRLARLAAVVSDVTSLWAADPRWRPGGLPPEVELSGRSGPCGVSSSHIGMGRFGTRGTRGVVAGGPPPPTFEPLLAGPVAACASRHGARRWRVDLVIETTGREIVDVEVASLGADGGAGGSGAGDPALAACVVEAAWALDLDESFAPWTRRFDVSVAGARP